LAHHFSYHQRRELQQLAQPQKLAMSPTPPIVAPSKPALLMASAAPQQAFNRS
jgi:hypothetical protein